MLRSARRIGFRCPQCNDNSSSQRWLSASSTTRLAQVDQLADWSLDNFRDNAFKKNVPVTLPFTPSALPPACRKWFIHEGDSLHDLKTRPQTSELRTSFWSEHESTIVPLELTSTTPSSKLSSSSQNTIKDDEETTFHRTHAPLKILLTYLGNPKSPFSSSSQNQNQNQTHSIYLAQCDLPSLPPALQADLPTPDLVLSSGKGDIYSSSLWLGRPPTYTPLHRDPNPNLFMQLAGRKVVRLFPPELGDAIFEHVQDQLSSRHQHRQQSNRDHIRFRGSSSSSSSSASFRGEEMMQGPEKELLHRIVWGEEAAEDFSSSSQSQSQSSVSTGENNNSQKQESPLLAYALEAHLDLGQGLFIPKGWWHSVKGVGGGVTASANWWFR